MSTIITPTKIKHAARCAYLPILAGKKDPNTGKKYWSSFDRKKVSQFHKGNYFEECITGIPYDTQRTDPGDYHAWKTMSSTKEARVKLQYYAEYCKKVFWIEGEEYFYGEELNYKFPDPDGEEDFLFEARGVSDARGKFKIEGQEMDLILDIKLTSDIAREWDLGGETDPEKFLQVGKYSLMHALKMSTDNTLFEKAISAGYNMDQANMELYFQQWANTTTILPGAFLICEDKNVPMKDGIPLANPIVRTYVIDMTWQGILQLYILLAKFDQLWRDLVALPDNQIRRIISPHPNKCLGMGRNSDKGQCPMLYYCKFGRSINEKVTLVRLDDITSMILK